MKKTFLALAFTASTFAIIPAARSQGLESVSINGVTSAVIADNFESTVNELQQIKSDALSRSVEYTLDEALKYTLANNPSINAAYKAVQSKQWAAISDKRLWWPTIMGAGPYGDLTTIPTFPSLGRRLMVDNTFGSNSVVVDSFTPALIARWTFFDLARGETINASTEAAKAEELLFNMTVRNSILDLYMNYYQLFAKQNLLQSLEKEYAATLRQLNYLIARQKTNSLKASSATTRTKTTLYLQLDKLINAYVDYIKASAAAAKSMGLPIGKLMKPADSFSLQPMNAWTMTLQDTLDHALDHREEIKLAKTIAKSQNYLATSLLYSYFPRISIFGYGSYSTEKNDGAVSEGWQGNVGLMFSWMFDGTLAAKSTSLKYAAKQQLQKAKETENLVAEQVSTTYAEYTAAKLSLANAKKAYESAYQTRESTQQLTSADSTDYSNAAQSVGNAAKNYAGAIFKYNASLSMLYRFSSIWPSGISEELNNTVKILKED